MYFLVVDDEWGVPYPAKMFEDIQEVRDEIRIMEELIDECSVSQVYALRACINQLKRIVHKAELYED